MEPLIAALHAADAILILKPGADNIINVTIQIENTHYKFPISNQCKTETFVSLITDVADRHNLKHHNNEQRKDTAVLD